MSFILDALKKSENERQRQIGPSLADLPVSKRSSDKPWWAVIVAALLVVNLGVLLIVLTRTDAKPAPQAAPATAAPAAQQQQRVMIPPPVAPPPGSNAHSLADEAAIGGESGVVDPLVNANPNLAAAAAVPEGPPMVRPIQPPNVTPTAVAPAVAPPSAASATASPNWMSRATAAPSASEVLPTSMELAAAGTSVPDMRLDIHVYSANPAERFVFVNMKKYTEGQTLAEGPTVERITPEGVIVNQRGLRYVVPRQ
jgi:general secretion pathway protein B